MKNFENGITFYDEKLPRHQLKGKECIWWEQTVGTSMKCLYKGKVYTIEFLDYEKRFLTIRCNSQIKRIEINTFYGNDGRKTARRAKRVRRSSTSTATGNPRPSMATNASFASTKAILGASSLAQSAPRAHRSKPLSSPTSTTTAAPRFSCLPMREATLA